LLFYYQVAILKYNLHILTYHSIEELSVGRVVVAPLNKVLKDGVIVSNVSKPIFETLAIDSCSDRYYSSTQIDIAKFISTYYFSSLSQSLALFLPYRLDYKISNTPSIGGEFKKPTLSSIQQKAYDDILSQNSSLLFGVTGSGKTEIFISLMVDMLHSGKSAIFLMPEISLTPQMEKRLRVYFGDSVAMWHSKLTKRKKESILEGIRAGDIRIIAGARSALFVPLDNIGIIIVDEEHDDSYKAMTKPRYHARDVAILMGKKIDAKVLLASATPSIGSYHKYPVVKLSKPFIETKKSYNFISGERLNSKIINTLAQNYKADAQSLLFLPTRGNFKYLYCSSCGKTHLCPYCSVGMALHSKYRHLKCHYCNYTEAIRDSCSHCNHTPLSSNRMGTVEAMDIITQSIDGIVVEQFDKDSISTIKKLKDALKRFETKQSHLLLGTQMLSKGHDYADITLSVIMGLDYILGLPDYRAKQRAVSLLFQIAGRSGRAKSSEVLIQSNSKETFEKYLSDYELFIKDEIEFLQIAEYPPFVSLARILISHKNEKKASKITLDTVIKLKEYRDIEIVGHGKAPIEKIADKFRFHILLRSKDRVPLLNALHQVDNPQIEIDMDALEFS